MSSQDGSEISRSSAPSRASSDTTLVGEETSSASEDGQPNLWTELVAIHTVDGDKEAIFFIDKELACYYSTFMTAACRYGRGAQPIDLEDVDPRIFTLFLHWLYSERRSNDSLGPEILRTVQPNDLCTLWVLGDYLGAKLLQNEVMVHLCRIQRGGPWGRIRYIYEMTPTDSVLRDWVVEQFASQMDVLVLYHRDSMFCRDFMLDVLMHLAANGQTCTHRAHARDFFV